MAALLDIQTSDGRNEFHPGEEIAGRVAWKSDAPIRSAEIRLVWYSRSQLRFAPCVVERIRLNLAQREDEREFRFRLPNMPYSYMGRILNFGWTVELVLDDGRLSKRFDFTLSPNGRAIAPRPAAEKSATTLQPGTRPEAAAAGVAQSAPNRPVGAGAPGRIAGAVGVAFYCAIFGFFIAFPAILFIYVPLREAGAGILRARSWQEVPCVITRSEVEEVRHQDAANSTYRARIEYDYVWADRTYNGQRYDFGRGSSAGRAGKDRVSAANPVGSRQTCYVNPSNPSEAVLYRGLPLGSGWLFLVTAPFMLIGAGGIAWTVWSALPMRRGSTAAAIGETPLDRPPAGDGALSLVRFGRFGGGRALVTLCSVFIIIGIVIAWFASARPLLRRQASLGWTPTPCRIVSSAVSTSSGEGSRASHRSAIRYEYAVGDRGYHSDRYDFLSHTPSSREAANRVVAANPVGAERICYVNPADPSDAVMERAWSNRYLYGCAGLIFTAFGLFFLWAGNMGRFSAWLARSQQAGTRPTARAAGELRRKSRLGVPIALTIVAIGWNALAWGILLPRSSSMPKVLPIVFVGAGLLIVAAAIWRWLAALAPTVRIVLEPMSPVIGDALRLRWKLGSRPQSFHNLKISLVQWEKGWIPSRDSDGRTCEALTTVPACDLVIFEAEEEVQAAEGSTELRLESLMPTFESAAGSVGWMIRVQAEVHGRPGIDDKYPLTISPA